MIEKGCLHYLDHVQNNSVPSLHCTESIYVVREFLDMFPTNLPSMPFNYEIDFSIDVESDTNLISITSYRMAQAELKELMTYL